MSAPRAGPACRMAISADRAGILEVHQRAFGRDEERLLVESLLADPSAQPLLSVVAERQGALVGHALFTAAAVPGAIDSAGASILAPLAVLPSAQRSGVGRGLIEAGCRLLAERGVALVFVLGDPGYYARVGFVAAFPHGLKAPYPIEPAAAWQVRALGGHVLGTVRGVVRCADALAPEHYWRE